MSKELFADVFENFYALKENSYPGRGLIIGLDESGLYMIQVYWIMGRSPDSRNRRFVKGENGLVRTEAVDPANVKDPSLIIYNAMRGKDRCYVVTNGDQTDTAMDIKPHLDINAFHSAMLTRKYEPDSPNFTPRISGIVSLSGNKPYAEIAILKKSTENDGCDRFFYSFPEFEKGIGYCVTTYMSNDNPLPAFEGRPYSLPLLGDMEDVIMSYWDTLNADNKVSLAVKCIEIAGGVSDILIINKY